MPDQAPNIDVKPGDGGRLVYDKERRTIVAQPARADDEDRMEKISALIARLQSTLDQWGDTCVYIRRGGLSWGAVALNRQADDMKHGVFDLQAQHDRDMLQRAEQVERLIASRKAAEMRLNEAVAALKNVQARTYSSDRRCRLDYEPVAEICDIVSAALSRI